MKRTHLLSAAVCALGLGLASQANAELIYGMTAASSASANPGQRLVFFDSATPGTVTNVGTFTGVVPGHALRNIDFRPATGELYAISTSTALPSTAQIYTVDLNTAALTPVGAGFALGTNNSAVVDMDFNPVVDRIRITTGGSATVNNNFRAHPDTGALVATDTNMDWDPGDPSVGQAFTIIGTAYSNNFAGATQTTLYGWDYQRDALVTIGGVNGTPSPNGGALFTVNVPAGFLTFNAGLDMDISGATGIMYVTHDNPNNSSIMGLYTRNPLTGAESFIGNYPAGTFISSISVVIPEPASLGLLGLAALGLRRRRA